MWIYVLNGLSHTYVFISNFVGLLVAYFMNDPATVLNFGRFGKCGRNERAQDEHRVQQHEQLFVQDNG